MVFGRNPRATLVRIVIWIVACVAVFKFALLRVEVDGISMVPAYQNHSKNWISRLAYLRHEPSRGDVVAVRLVPANDFISRLKPPGVMLLKRIIGLPGETVAFADGRVLINGQILDEPYEKQNDCDWNIAPVKLAEDEYYVVGDNRSMPEQNHTKGVFKRNQILGKIMR
jgi:signal peptidase I